MEIGVPASSSHGLRQELASSSVLQNQASKSSSKVSSGSTTRPAVSAIVGTEESLRDAIAAMSKDADIQQLVVEQVIGKGTYGVVYKGRWRNLPVAVKSLLFQDVAAEGGRNAAEPSLRQRAITEVSICP